MAVICIIGTSGSGKSSSIRNLEPKETILIKVVNKELPYKKGRKHYSKEMKNCVVLDNPETIQVAIQKASVNKNIKTIIIDDAQYIMANEYMRRADDKGFSKFVEIGKKFWELITFCCNTTNEREDLDIFVLSHSETDDFGNTKMKTIGKMLDNTIVMEGLFTIILNAEIKDGEYVFRTKSNGNDPIKSPIDMIEEKYIPNDLKLLKEIVKKYYDDDEEEILKKDTKVLDKK